jgi:hypothetical protein
VSATGSVKIPCGYLNPDDGKYYNTITTPCADPPDDGETLTGTCVCAGTDKSFDYSVDITYTISKSTDDIRSKEEDDDTGECVETIESEGDCALTQNTPSIPCSPGNYYPVLRFLPDGTPQQLVPDDCSHPTPAKTEQEPWYLDSSQIKYDGEVKAETADEAFKRVLDSLPAFPNTPNGAAISTRYISPDGFGVAAAKAKYRFAIQPTASCYLKITWKERFTPHDHSLAPKDTEMTHLWEPPSVDGLCIPAGYDPADVSTWSHTPDFILNPPAQDGSVTVVDIRFSCIEGADPQPGGDQ